MPSGYLTSSSLIATVKREAMIPTAQQTFTDADFLAIANQEIRIGMLPSIMIYHEEYYVVDSDPIAIVANQSNYPIPYRAVGGKFREIFFQDNQNHLVTMTRINPDYRPLYQQSVISNNFIYFYIKGNDVVLLPDVQSNPTGSLVFSYYMRPNELVDENRVATITDISVGASTTVFTVDNIPQNLPSFVQDGVTLTGFSTSAVLDVLQRRPGHQTINFDIQATNVDSVNKMITFNNDDLNDSIIVGDYIAFAGECIIPQIPSDLHEVLVQRVIQRCMQALGDVQGVQVSAGKLAEMEKNTGMLIDNRSEGQAQKISNIRGLLGTSKLRRRSRFSF